jgi:hypothetical protein
VNSRRLSLHFNNFFVASSLDCFNEGWIDFEFGEADSQKGSVAWKTVLKALIADCL